MQDTSQESSQIIFKRVIPEHIPQLVGLRVEFLISLKGEQPREKTEMLTEHLNRYFERAIPAETFVGWMAWDGEKAVGAGGLVVREQPGHFNWPEGRLGYILNMYTIPDYRNKGIGTEILQRLIAYGKEAGLGRIELHASPDGEPLYRKYGFEEWGEPHLMLRFR